MTVDTTSIIAVAALILTVIGATWSLAHSMGGLKESVANSASASSEAHANIGKRIDETRKDIGEVRERVDRVLENQPASGGHGQGISITPEMLRSALRDIAKESDTED